MSGGIRTEGSEQRIQVKGSERMDLSGGIRAEASKRRNLSGCIRAEGFEWRDLGRGIRADESNQRDPSGVSEWRDTS